MKTCERCGSDLLPDAPHGLCVRCLLSTADSDGKPKGDSLFHDAMIDIGNLAEVARRLPQFEILQLLGSGGMGVVYKARQLQLNRTVGKPARGEWALVVSIY